MICAGFMRRAVGLVVCALSVGALAASIASDGASAAGRMPRIQLSVRPAMADGFAVTRFHFVATLGVGVNARAVRAALVRFAGARARTDRRGRAVIVRRLRPGSYRARVCKGALACGSARVSVLARGAAR